MSILKAAIQCINNILSYSCHTKTTLVHMYMYLPTHYLYESSLNWVLNQNYHVHFQSQNHHVYTESLVSNTSNEL